MAASLSSVWIKWEACKRHSSCLRGDATELTMTYPRKKITGAAVSVEDLFLFVCTAAWTTNCFFCKRLKPRGWGDTQDASHLYCNQGALLHLECGITIQQCGVNKQDGIEIRLYYKHRIKRHCRLSSRPRTALKSREQPALAMEKRKGLLYGSSVWELNTDIRRMNY